MPVRPVLERAKKLLRLRRFPDAISLLEMNIVEYQNSFEFYYLLGTAYIYAGDFGGADTYIKRARRITLLDPRLLIAQAVLFLRRGDTDQAVQYYLDVLDTQPSNKTAVKALQFIKRHGDPDTIMRWVETGKIKQFYPPLGTNLGIIRLSSIAAIFVAALSVSAYLFLHRPSFDGGKRADINALSLSAEESRHAAAIDSSAELYRYMLTPKEINRIYDDARRYFQNYRDNAAQVEINTILNSNAAVSIRQKARVLMTYFSEPTFDSLVDNYSYQIVAANPHRYADCWVIWSGRISNWRTESQGARCDFFVGYDTLKTVDGILPLTFRSAIDIDPTLSVKVLGKLVFQDGNLALEGKSVYQPIAGTN